MADSMEAASKAHDSHNLYQLLKQATGRKQQVSERICLKDGQIIMDLSATLVDIAAKLFDILLLNSFIQTQEEGMRKEQAGL